jgi:hypothetical protein
MTKVWVLLKSRIGFLKMVLKYYHLLYPMVEFKYLVDQENDEDCNLDIFKMTTNTNKLAKDLVKREFLIFR